MKYRSEFLIAATKSGSGKTLLTLGILAAMARRGIDVQPFKCGPDFIDPSLHEQVVNRHSINLDLHMMGRDGCLKSYARYGQESDAVIVEGVMGLFDGGSFSSASLAELLDIPVLLIIDVRSAAESVAAVLKGFEVYNPHTRICGVIFNRVGSERHRQLIEDAVTGSCSSKILGFFPRDIDFEMPSRHLGLHMGHEQDYSSTHLEKLAESVEQHIDIDQLLQISQQQFKHNKPDQAQPVTQDIRLAVARDEAFCFYYEENFEILRSNGFEIVPFSPLHDSRLPDNIQGIYLGGGYPELYARALSANSAMRESILQWAQSDGFIYGECGGFMYMTRQLTDIDGVTHPMSGIFQVSVKMKPRLSKLGYRKMEIKKDCGLGESGQFVYGHEFHYSDIVERHSDIEFLYDFDDGRSEGCLMGNSFGSYVHLHFSQSVENIHRLHSLLAKK
ncbi:cobyrinate a,c-diamide synthase [Desulfosediminicola flagellatus]|uniref:cobyrinate a,c-diamide synthase n=1 Tax=Desulfosediminicola flagellatus TaxID=2569541 RepID=UPI0010ACF0A8|nr:cobyrinate a,c-diamide synthase [Desulfosediminicola flagellatus]